jgi:hypothetical protein
VQGTCVEESSLAAISLLECLRILPRTFPQKYGLGDIPVFMQSTGKRRNATHFLATLCG